MMNKLLLICSTAVLAGLSGCVTQNYSDSDKPIVQNESTSSEIALTRISLGLGYLQMGNTTQAKFNLERAKRYAPNLVQVYTAFAHYYESVGEDSLTIASYEKALSLKPDDADTLNNYGVFLCRKELMDDAEKQFLKAINVPSYIRVSESYENLALCQLKVHNFEKGELYLQKAIDHSPSNGSTLYEMMRLQYAKADYVLAQGYGKRFEKAARRFTPEFLALSYKTYLKLKQDSKANNYSAMLIKMYPESWQAKQFLLNGLESIDADELATEYKILSANNKNSSKPVVVLKPKTQKAPIAFTKKKERSNKPVKQVTYTKPVDTVATEEPQAEILEDNSLELAKDLSPAPPRITRKKVPSAPVERSDKRVIVLSKPRAKLETISETEQIASESEAQVTAQQQAEVVENTEQQTDTLIANIERLNDENVALPDTLEEIEAELKALEQQLPEAELKSAEFDNDAIENSDVIAPESVQSTDNSEQLASVSENDEKDQLTLVSESDENPEIALAAESEVSQTPLLETEISENTEQQDLEQNLQSNELFVDSSTPSEQVNIAANDNSSETLEEITVDIGEDEPNYQTLADLPTHKLAYGENLFKVSRRYNIQLHALRKWNDLDKDSVLIEGDTILLADPNLVSSEEQNDKDE